MAKRFSCHKISEGKATADAIISKDRIMFYQVRPEDGMMEEKNHHLEGRIIAKKVLLFPGGKGSSVVQQDGLYHLDRFHNMPAALIVQNPDPVQLRHNKIKQNKVRFCFADHPQSLLTIFCFSNNLNFMSKHIFTAIK